MIANLRAADIGAVFLIGGNGTMAGAQRLAAEAENRGLALQVIGIPKTIDNDLAGCDVTPGYGSAARYVAYTTQEIGLDLRAMRGFDQVAVVEVMGRHVGWVAAATALARQVAGDPPHLILLPEAPVEIDQVLTRIAEVYAQRQLCTIVVAEGVRERSGAYWAELVDGAAYDGSGQRVFSMSAGASAFLVREVQARLGLRCRQIKLNTAQRATRAARQRRRPNAGADGRYGGGGGVGGWRDRACCRCWCVKMAPGRRAWWRSARQSAASARCRRPLSTGRELRRDGELPALHRRGYRRGAAGADRVD